MTASPDTIEKYLAIPSIGGGDYHPGRPEIAYISSETGVYQVYVKNLETGTITRVSRGDDRCTNPVYLPNGDLLYVTDSGGDEHYQFMVYTGAATYRLTDPLDAKHNFAFASDDAVYLSANIDDRERLDVYRYTFPLSPSQAPELVMRAQSGFPLRPLLASDDGSRLIISRACSNLKNELLAYHIPTRETVPLTERVFPGHNSRFEPVEFLGAHRLLVISDHEREYRGLAVFDFDAGSLAWLEEDRFDTGHAELFDGNQVLFSKNVDGSDRLYRATIGELQLEKVKSLPLPDEFAVLPSGDFRSFTKPFVVNRQGSRALLSCSSPTRITNIMEIDLAANTLTTALAPVIFDGGAFVDPGLHSFSSFDGLKVPYYLYAPPGTGPFPAIFIIHGGPESQSRSAFNNQIQLMVNQGYLVVVPNIRGSSGYGRTYLALDDVEKRLDSIRDIQSLAAHLAENEAKIDADRMVIYGGSYGGFAVLSSITEYPGLFTAAVDIVGISNFVTFLEHTASWRRQLRAAEYGSLERNRDFLASVSPINKVDRIQTPLLIVQGRNDERVPLGESVQMHEALVQRNVPCDLLIFDDEGHGVVKKTNQLVQFQTMFRFLDKHLTANAGEA